MVDKDTEARWKQEDQTLTSPEVDLYFAAKAFLDAWFDEFKDLPILNLRDAVEAYEKSGAVLRAETKVACKVLKQAERAILKAKGE